MAQTSSASSSGGGVGGLGPSQGIEIRTKFPVARIKRIMQADEEVGKVAQVTPVAVCKFFSILFSPKIKHPSFSNKTQILKFTPTKKKEQHHN